MKNQQSAKGKQPKKRRYKQQVKDKEMEIKEKS